MMSLKSVCRLPPWTHWCVNKENIVDFYSQCELTVSEFWKGNDFWNFTVQKKKDALLMSGAEPEFVLVRGCKNLEEVTQTSVSTDLPECSEDPSKSGSVSRSGRSVLGWRFKSILTTFFFLLADRVNGNQQSSSSCLGTSCMFPPFFMSVHWLAEH